MTSQIILKYVASFFSYAADILINIWFFSRIDNKDRRSTVAGYLPLFLLFFLFFTPERLLPIADSRSLYNYGFQAGRLLYRWGMVYGYIWAIFIRKTHKPLFCCGHQPTASWELSSIYSAIRRNSSAYLNFTLMFPPS